MIVRVRGVKKVRSKGRIYYYHRATNTRLPDDPRSAEFISKLRALEAKQQAAPGPGTLGGLITQYHASPEWSNLAPRTKAYYNKTLDYFKPLDAMPLVNIDRQFIWKLRDQTASTHAQSFTNHVLLVLQLLFNWGMRRGLCESNPVLGVDRVKKPKDAPIKNRPWTEKEFDIVFSAASHSLQLAISLAAFAGLRESDVVKVTWGCYDGQSIETRQRKTGAPVWVPAHYKLRDLLDHSPRVSPLIVLNRQGMPYTTSALRTEFFRLLRKLKAAGEVGPGLSLHGLRHTLGTRLAEAGCDAQTIASVLGQQTTVMAEHYSRTANRRGNASAAIERLEKRDREAG
jgi:integrase